MSLRAIKDFNSGEVINKVSSCPVDDFLEEEIDSNEYSCFEKSVILFIHSGIWDLQHIR